MVPSLRPFFHFAQFSPLLWSISRFWSSFTGTEVSKEEEYSILRILYCYSLQQHIFLAFCKDVDTHYPMLTYIFFSNIFIDYKRTNYGKFSLKFRGAQIWNKLPKDLKLLKSYRQFKQSSKVYVQNYMYSKLENS